MSRTGYSLTGMIFVLAASPLMAAEEYTFWISECTPALVGQTACRTEDPTLGRWALEAWERESQGAIRFKRSLSEHHARIRMYWTGGRDSLYGETKPVEVDGKRGAEIYVLPKLSGDIAKVGSGDGLLRDAVVYLTCLHEAGHALGLPHTREFADIMYAFGYGGDIVEYFQRYRRHLKAREDIQKHSGISVADGVAFRLALER